MFKGNKAHHYARELQNARLRGIPFVHTGTEAATGYSTAMKELIRKFSKHNPAQSTTSRIATIEHEMQAIVLSFFQEAGYRDASHANDSPASAVFPPVIEPSSSYAPGIETLLQELERIAPTTAQATNNATACVSLSALGLFMLGRDTQVMDLIQHTHLLDMDPVSTPIDEHHVAVTIMGACLFAMACERATMNGTEDALGDALDGYERAIALHERVRGSASAKGARMSPFVDEMERWIETALYRDALLTLRLRTPNEGAAALRAYQAHEARWPGKFRLTQRNVLRNLYASMLNSERATATSTSTPAAAGAGAGAAVVSAATVTTTPTSASFARTKSKRRPNGDAPVDAAPSTWSAQFASMKETVTRLLQSAPAFPHADESNANAERLAEQLVESWRLDGTHNATGADQVVELLYGLTRITFRSQTILRLLVYMLVAAEAYAEACTLLPKYMALVESTWQATGVPVARDTTALRAVDGPTEWVTTVLLGAHTMLHYQQQPAEALQLLDQLRAATGDVGDETRMRVDAPMLARILRNAGEARLAMVRTASPTQRPVFLRDAHDLLQRAVTLDQDSSEAHYALAYALALEQKKDEAMGYARRALELEPSFIDGWHLIVLLLSADRAYTKARDLAAEALSQIEADYEEGHNIPAQARAQLLSFDYPPTRLERACAYVRLLLTHNALVELTDGAQAALDDQRDVFAAFQAQVAPLTLAPTAPNDVAFQTAPRFTQPPLAELAESPTVARTAYRARLGTRLLQTLWLHSAATFRRTDDLEQARNAIAEAEQLDGRRADVWVQLAQWCLASGGQAGAAVTCLYKALACETDHVAASVLLARVLLHPTEELHLRASHAESIAAVGSAPDGADLLTNRVLLDGEGLASPIEAEEHARAMSSRSLGSASGTGELTPVAPVFQWKTDATLSSMGIAEGLLRTATMFRGWDVPEAWHMLAQLAQQTGRTHDVERRSLLEALRLESARPIRPWRDALAWP